MHLVGCTRTKPELSQKEFHEGGDKHGRVTSSQYSEDAMATVPDNYNYVHAIIFRFMAIICQFLTNTFLFLTVISQFMNVI